MTESRPSKNERSNRTTNNINSNDVRRLLHYATGCDWFWETCPTDGLRSTTGRLQHQPPTIRQIDQSVSRPSASCVHSRTSIQHGPAPVARGRAARGDRDDLQLLLHEPATVRVGRHDRLQGVPALRVAGLEPRLELQPDAGVEGPLAPL